MAKERKFAAYLCTGCGIGERLDAARLEQVATRDADILVRQHAALCSRAGVEMIRKDIDKDGITHLMIAACSPRAKIEAFHFPDVAMSRANLREGVIWARPEGAEQQITQEMADDHIRMACAEIRHMQPPECSAEQPLNRHILVVGGGITGMTAALEAAAAGYPVHLVEKTDALGGHAARWHKLIPGGQTASNAGNTIDMLQAADNNSAEMITAVEASERISLYLNSRVARTSGAPGRFSVDIIGPSGDHQTIRAGAIVQATGFKLYDPGKLEPYHYAGSADIITNAELEALARAAGDGPIKRPSDGKPVQSVAFVQHVGQCSDAEGELPYHSGIGDLIAIKQALYFKQQNKDCDTTLIVDHLRTPGVAGENFYRAGQQARVTFTKGKVTEVVPGDALQVKFRDLILDEDSELACDLVVLDVGMVPNSGPDPYAESETLERPSDANGKAVEVSVESILNLDYRQGSDLPQLKYGFTDSHFICFPYETRRSGIYAAGPLRYPMDIGQARDDAAGAALKAIQAVGNAARGRAGPPRAGDLSFPSFRKSGCTQCKRCSVECPFGAIDEDQSRYPVFHESRCRRCGICMGACPVRVISFNNYSTDSVGQQIKGIDIPDAVDEKPRILVLACENDAYPALDQAAMAGQHISPWARVIPVRCLGSVSLSWISDALNNGYDGIVMMGCQRGVDYQCHFIRGSGLAAERMKRISDTLQPLNLEAERIALHEVAITDITRAPALIAQMESVVQQLGLSPFKF